MSDHMRDDRAASPAPAPRNFTYPWAAAPDMIRSRQKDAYFQHLLLDQFAGVLRALYGARAAHNWTAEVRTLTELLYLALTTGVGNRTLGEEYCDIVQVVDDDSRRLPSLSRRTAYILSSVLLPYGLQRFLPAFRRRLRAKLEVSVKRTQERRASSPSGRERQPRRVAQLQEYVLKHLDSLTSPAPFYALGLAVFYCNGAYYQLSKRVVGLRYIFTRRLEPSEQRLGYEVLGLLLLLQMLVQAYLHVRDTYSHLHRSPDPQSNPAAAMVGTSATLDGGVEVSTATTTTTAPAVPLLFEATPPTTDPSVAKARLAEMTHTPPPQTQPHRYDLEDQQVMPWIDGLQQRKCTLCLEAMKDPAVTTCGHVFCWRCITDWLREQPLCPLCRQSALAQHVLPLRG